MKHKTIYRFGAYLMTIPMLLANVTLCHAAEYDPAGSGIESTDVNGAGTENSEIGNGYEIESGYETENTENEYGAGNSENGYESGNTENGYGGGSNENGYAAENVEAPETNNDEPQSVEDIYVLEADRRQISFGSLEQGSFAARQDIVLTNSGLADIWVLWHEADYHDCITVDAPDNDYLSPGESCTFSVEADTSLAPGVYSTFILFGDADDPYFEHGVQVDISLEIKAPAPALPRITSVSISPGTTVMSKNSSCAFTASVSGENDYDREVIWDVSGQTSPNTFIDSTGTLKIGSDEKASSLTVRAASKQDGNYSASALVSLQTSSYFIQLQANPADGGVVHGGGAVAEGESTVISAAPHNGYVFGGWSLNNSMVSSNSQYTVSNVRRDETYVALFQPVSCRINVSVNNSNAGTATGSQNVSYNGSVTLEAAAKDGYQFDGWMENGAIINTDSKMQLNHITAPRNFTAVFTQNKFNLSLTCSPANTGTVSGAGIYHKGSNARVTAAPVEGYKFVGWAENGNIISTEKEYSINNISRDLHFTAVFDREQAKTYTINSSVSSPNGIISPEGKSVISEGSGVLYTITPKSGYIVSAVYVDGKLAGAVSTYRFTNVRENHNISADFAAIPKQADNNKAAAPQADNPNDPKTDGTKTAAADAAVTSAPAEAQEDIRRQLDMVEMNQLSGTLQSLNITVKDAEKLIDENNDMELMNGAILTGDLQVTIHNDFAENVQETSYSSFYENTSIINFGTILDHILTREEKLDMLQGLNPIAINLHIDNTDGEEQPLIIRLFDENKEGAMQIGGYFEMFLMEAKQNDVHLITELPAEMKAVINVPDNLKADGREFYILRLHANENGGMDFATLMDEDDSPDTISFSTDKFSPYAIAYIDRQAVEAGALEIAESIENNKTAASVVVIAAIIFAIVVTFFLTFYIVKTEKHIHRKKRK